MHEPSAVVMRAGEPYEDRSLKELVSGVGRDMGLLVRQEIQLAKAELGEKVSRVTTGAVTIGIGAVLAYAGLLAIVAALVLVAIEIGLAPWLAAALVGLVLIVAGFAAISGGKRKATSGPPALARTKVNAQETVQHLKEQLR